jgi:hypothetical protein
VKVCHSATPNGEKHTDKELTRQWNAIDRDKEKTNVSRLQLGLQRNRANNNGLSAYCCPEFGL